MRYLWHISNVNYLLSLISYSTFILLSVWKCETDVFIADIFIELETACLKTNKKHEHSSAFQSCKTLYRFRCLRTVTSDALLRDAIVYAVASSMHDACNPTSPSSVKLNTCVPIWIVAFPLMLSISFTRVSCCIFIFAL